MKKIIFFTLSLLLLTACSNNEIVNPDDINNTQELNLKDESNVTIELQASADKIRVDEYLDVAVKINTGRDYVNTLQIFLNYDPDLFDIDHITTVYSEFTIWTKKEIDNGLIKLQAAEPNPGVYGSNKELATIVFRSKKAGNAEIIIDNSMSKIYTNEDINKMKESGHKNLSIEILENENNDIEEEQDLDSN
jgi:uncharacterized protein YcfL